MLVIIKILNNTIFLLYKDISTIMIIMETIEELPEFRDLVECCKRCMEMEDNPHMIVNLKNELFKLERCKTELTDRLIFGIKFGYYK